MVLCIPKNEDLYYYDMPQRCNFDIMSSHTPCQWAMRAERCAVKLIIHFTIFKFHE